jgi:hypothetical protein
VGTEQVVRAPGPPTRGPAEGGGPRSGLSELTGQTEQPGPKGSGETAGYENFTSAVATVAPVRPGDDEYFQ